MSSTVQLINVLIVHEQKDMCQLWQKIIDMAPGMSCPAYALDGESAVRMAADHLPHVVLMQINLPGTIDGVDAAQQIREQQDDTLIIMTYTEQDEARARAADAAGYLQMPIPPDQLKQQIRQIYKAHHNKL